MPLLKIKRKIVTFLIIYFAVYLVVILVPACVYGIFSADTRSDTEKLSENSEAPPDFLDGAIPSSQPVDKGDKQKYFTLYDEATSETLQLTAEELLPAAIACEMDLSAPREALKAQAVACYTLFCKKRADGEIITCNSEKRQVYATDETLRERWGEDFDGHMELLRDIVDEVDGQLLTWEGEPILAPYYAISGGCTETAANVWQIDLPYLQAVASAGDAFSDGYASTVRMTAEEFSAAAAEMENPPNLSGAEADWLTDLSYSPSGYVKTAFLGGVEVSGQELRTIFSLRSACFDFAYRDGEFIFTVRGWGHGVGMSQAGAVFMAKRGADYKEILAHYYPGTVLETAVS